MSEEENTPDYLETDMTSTEYEVLTQGIYQAIINDEDNDNINVKHNVTVTGKSGAKHQIDVLWEHKIAGKEYKTFIECKHYKRSVSIGHIRNFFGVLQDTDATGIFVTKIGYQSGAQIYANFYNIDTKVIKPIDEADLDGKIRKIFLNVHILTLSNTPPPVVTICFTGKDSNGSPFSQSISNKIQELLTDQQQAQHTLGALASFCDKSGKHETETIGEMLPRLLPLIEKGQGGPFNETIKLEDKYLDIDGTLIEVNQLKVKYHVNAHLSQTETKDALHIYSHILKDFKTGNIEFMNKRDD